MSPNQHTWQDIEVFKKVLKEKGLKATRTRLAVHRAMMELGHASADMVYDAIRNSDTNAIRNSDTNARNASANDNAPAPRVTQSSVYNILTHMTSLGIYQNRMSIGSKMFFDVNPTRQIHLYDPHNSVYVDISDDDLLDLIETKLKRRRFKGYKVDRIDVQFICHATRKKQ